MTTRNRTHRQLPEGDDVILRHSFIYVVTASALKLGLHMQTGAANIQQLFRTRAHAHINLTGKGVYPTPVQLTIGPKEWGQAYSTPGLFMRITVEYSITKAPDNSEHGTEPPKFSVF
jgi:hypothetical protein